jgi:hypothetical protein
MPFEELVLTGGLARKGFYIKCCIYTNLKILQFTKYLHFFIQLV